jgi:hypothetical protein
VPLGRPRLGNLAVEVWWLHPVGHGVHILKSGPKALEDTAERVAGRPVRLCPSSSKLDAGNGIVSGADCYAVAASVAIIAVWALVASGAALTCAHLLNCIGIGTPGVPTYNPGVL